MKQVLWLLLTFYLCLEAPIALGQDECYSLLKIRLDHHHQQYTFNGLELNPEEDLFDSLTRNEVPYYEFFSKMAKLCSELCQGKGYDCIGYLAGTFIDPDLQRDPELALQRLFPNYNKENDGIENAVKDPDCICIRESNSNSNLSQEYNQVKLSFQSNSVIFEMLWNIVKFWHVLHQHLSFGTPHGDVLNDTLRMHQCMHQKQAPF